MLSVKNQPTEQILSLHETRSRYTRDTYTPHYFVGLFKRPDSSTLPLPVDARCPAAVLHLLFQPHIHASVHLQAQGLRVFSSSFTVMSRLMCCGESGVRSPYSKHVTCICCSNKHFDLELPDWNSLTQGNKAMSDWPSADRWITLVFGFQGESGTRGPPGPSGSPVSPLCFLFFFVFLS